MENPTENCRNCQHPLPDGAKYCPACGQKDTDGRLTFGQLMHEFSSNLLNLDTKIFRTLAALAVPGNLTVEYFKGKHVPYYHPVRLFIIAAAAFLALLSLTIDKDQLSGLKSDWEKKQERFIKHGHYRQLSAIKDSLAQEYKHPSATIAMDSLLKKFSDGHDYSKGDSMSFPVNLHFTGDNNSKDAVEIAEADFLTLREDSLAKKYNVHGFWKKLIFTQGIRIQKTGDNFVLYLIGNALWMMLVMMPLLAVVLKLIYVRRNFLYFEHLVFSFHTHTFVFLLSALLLVLQKFLPGIIWLFAAAASAFYLYFSMKRFYGQGQRKTFVKFCLANILYMFIFSLAFLLTIIASAVFY